MALDDTVQSPLKAGFYTLGSWVDAQPFIEIEHLGGGGGWVAGRKRMSSLLAS